MADNTGHNHWKVIVGNIGIVYSGTNGFEANSKFQTYSGQSKSGVGRAGGEPVTLMCNGEIQREYVPAISRLTEDEFEGQS